MNITQLCEKIELQETFVRCIIDFLREFDFHTIDETISALTKPESSEKAYFELKDTLGEDPRGIKILTCYLLAATQTYENYLALDIDEAIFFDTMRCFPRYINETAERKGIMAFDRAQFCHRHLSMTILRIGTLEYERKLREDIRVNAVHIPTDADFSDEALDRSFASARCLIREKFPEYGDAKITCESWLLGKNLEEMLPENSRILKFQKRFDIFPSRVPGTDYLKFIFHRDDCRNYETLPENTSLQRRIKEKLLRGEGIECGFGILKENL